MSRSKISTIIDRPVRLLTTGQGAEGVWRIEVRDLKTDELLGSTDSESLFDREDNYFEYDVD